MFARSATSGSQVPDGPVRAMGASDSCFVLAGESLTV